MWFLPTRRRIAQLTQFMRSAIECGISTEGRILVQRDEFDVCRHQYEAIPLPAGWAYQPTNGDGMGDKVREFDWRPYEWTGWLVDDLICKTPEFDKRLIAGLNGKNFVSAWDGGQNPTRMCVPVFSRALLEAVGYIYPPGFWHTYCDDVWEYLGRQTQCWQPDLSVILEHEHCFANGRMVNPDETAIKSYSRMAEDKLAYDRWLKYLAPATITNIKAMQNAG